jgi:hypothetical protein
MVDYLKWVIKRFAKSISSIVIGHWLTLSSLLTKTKKERSFGHKDPKSFISDVIISATSDRSVRNELRRPEKISSS